MADVEEGVDGWSLVNSWRPENTKERRDSSGVTRSRGSSVTSMEQHAAHGTQHYSYGKSDFGENDAVPPLQFFEVEEDELETSGDDGFTTTAYEQLAAAVLDLLQKSGLTGSRLAIQEDEAPEMLTQALEELGVTASVDARSHVLAELYRAIEKAAAEEGLRKRARSNHTNVTLARILDRKEAEVWLAANGSSNQLDSVMNLVVPMKGQRRTRRGLERPVQGPEQRKVEDARRLAKLQGELVEFLIEGTAPCTVLVKSAPDPLKLLMNVIGKTRLGTAEKYIRIWRLFRSWLLEVHNTAWPKEVYQLLEYLFVLREEAGGPTVPQKWYQACSWMYRKGGFVGEEVLVKAGLVRETVDKMLTEIQITPVKQATRFPILVLVSLEVYLCDESKPPFKRIAAGALLLRSWATLRRDDQQHLQRSSLRIVGDYVIAELLMSKTSGPGKRVRQLMVALAIDVQLTGLSWAATFVELLAMHQTKDADYLLDGSDRRRLKSTGVMETYQEAASMTRTLMGELRVPELNEAGWTATDLRVIPEGLEDLFTQHSPRPVIPSMAIHVEPDEAKRHAVGRWHAAKAAGSADYVRTFRDVVGSVQVKVMNAILEGDERVLKEHDIVDSAARHLRERRGWAEERIRTTTGEWGQLLMRFAKSLGPSMKKFADIENISRIAILERASHVETVGLRESFEKKASGRNTVKREKRFVITYDRNRRKARLHSTQRSCYWASVEVRDSESFDVVSTDMYSSRCKFCWPQFIKETADLRESESEDSSGDESESEA